MRLKFRVSLVTTAYPSFKIDAFIRLLPADSRDDLRCSFRNGMNGNRCS